MAGGKLAIKSRIKSVDSTKKITKAMQLVAASKLTKCKNKMFQNKEYAFYLKETVNEILTNLKNEKHKYLKQVEDTKPLTVIFTSNMGLCGGYNANINKYIQTNISKEDPIVMIGNRGETWIKNKGYNVVKVINNLEEDDYNDIAQLADELITMYVNEEITSISVLYTAYLNAISFEPTKVKLLPAEAEAETTDTNKKLNANVEFEPKGTVILNDLVPLYIKSVLFSSLLETKTSESASRRSAMETATDNAEELKELLELQFNQARQASITQEITEIVGGASAL